MIGSKVLDDDKRDTGIGRHVFEELFEGFEAAGGSAQCRNQSSIRGRFAFVGPLWKGRSFHF